MPRRRSDGPRERGAEARREQAQPAAVPAPAPGLLAGSWAAAGNAAIARLIQRLGSDPVGGAPLDPALAERIEQRRGGGSPLPDGLRESLGQQLGTDLSPVRVHTDGAADGLSRAVQARAFTTGSDIFFSSGSYQPGSAEGRELIAHETVHVAQQGSGGIAREARVSDPADPAETEATRLARVLAAGLGPAVGNRALAQVLSRAIDAPMSIHRDTGSSSSTDGPTSYPGDVEEVPPSQSPQERAADLDRDYQGWLAEGNYSEAAQALNGFNLEDINARLSKLSPQQIAWMHQAAVGSPQLGRMSQVALVTGVDAESDGRSWWQKNEDVVLDIAKSKGLVLLGEQLGAKKFPQAIGGKLGGIIGWAIDFATSPGGDASLPHTIFQAAVSPEGIPVPVVLDGQVADWHRNRENAEKDAAAYTAKTGEQTMIDWEYSKNPDDPD